MPDKPQITALTPAWYVLHTRSRFETVVYDALRKKAVEVLLPKIQVPSKRRDRKVILHVPLFPGYVFVRTDLHPEHHLTILKTVGAVRLIGTHDTPVPVPERSIESLNIMAGSEQPIVTGNNLRRGDPVMVVSGPFTGVSGIFVRYGKQGRVLVQIEALGQYAAAEVDEADVEIQGRLYG
ncbi:MAG: UpxY family transcription antiterminator [Desulfobacterales bacterium]